MAQNGLNSRPKVSLTGSERQFLALSIALSVALAALVFWGTGPTEGAIFRAIAAIMLGAVPGAGVSLWLRAELRVRQAEDKLTRQADQLNSVSDKLFRLSSEFDAIELSKPAPLPDEKLLEQVREIASAQQKTQSALAIFMSSRAAMERSTPQAAEAAIAPEEGMSPQLPFADAPEAKMMQLGDLIKAAHFPKTADDRVGFTAMRLALGNPQTRPFIHAAQDILTLLSQEGVYMDDLTPDRARPEIWRQFADGQRGHVIAPLGGIRDRKVIEKVAERMRTDSVFRDAAHHFLRLFDKLFCSFAEEATDEEIARFAETRSSRAFMLLGRISGTFD